MSITTLDQEIEAKELASIIDRVQYKYSIYCLTDNERCGSQDEEAEEIYWLNRLKETLTNKINNRNK